MIFYLDTSLIVSALTQEPGTARVQEWLRASKADEFLVSEWTLTELSSALSIKIRTGMITRDERDAALLGFTKFRTESLTVVPVRVRHFRSAADLTRNPDLGLRSGDALHLAIASEHTATVCCLDRRLAEAGPPLGIETLLLR